MQDDIELSKNTFTNFTDLQLQFVEEYLLSGDPYKAAIRAGYDEADAKKFAKNFESISKILNAIEINKRVEAEVMNTWLPVAAIASRAGVTIRTTLAILVRLYNQGKLRMSYSRIDGHNKVHMFKKIETQKIMGVYTVVESGAEEL